MRPRRGEGPGETVTARAEPPTPPPPCLLLLLPAQLLQDRARGCAAVSHRPLGWRGHGGGARNAPCPARLERRRADLKMGGKGMVRGPRRSRVAGEEQEENLPFRSWGRNPPSVARRGVPGGWTVTCASPVAFPGRGCRRARWVYVAAGAGVECRAPEVLHPSGRGGCCRVQEPRAGGVAGQLFSFSHFAPNTPRF